MTRRSIASAGVILALVALSTSLSLSTRETLADPPIIYPNRLCQPVQNPQCPTKQSICKGNPMSIYCANDGQPMEGTCVRQGTDACSDFGQITCGLQTFCTGMYTTDPPTQCVLNVNACKTIIKH